MTDVARARALAGALFEVLGRWVPSERDPEAKLLFARHSLTVGAHVALLGVPDGADTAEVSDIAGAVGTRARLEAAYGRGLPALAAAYAAANVSDGLRADVDRARSEGERALAGAS